MSRSSRHHWYGEEPFPWQGITVWASLIALILICVFAVIVGCHYLPWWR